VTIFGNLKKMPIIKCTNSECPTKETCLRFKYKGDFIQSYYAYKVNTGDLQCFAYVPIVNVSETETRKTD
jgi:hypothetical protein